MWLVPLREEMVPASLGGLLPVAQLWGVDDDGYRWDMVAKATITELDLIISTVEAAPDDLLNWLAGPAADKPPSPEYLALTCLLMAFDQAQLRRNRSLTGAEEEL